jgi:hypothetical protein
MWTRRGRPSPRTIGSRRHLRRIGDQEHIVFAYDYPILGLFWTMTIFFLWAGWWFAAIWSFIDNFRRHDHSGWAKAGWALFIILIPLIGVFSYLVARPRGIDTGRDVAGQYATG